MLERKLIDLHLDDADENIKVRRVSTAECIILLGYLPDFYSTAPNETEEQRITRMASPKNLEGSAKWACKGISVHGSKKIVPQVEVTAEDEFSYFELSDRDQSKLFLTVCLGTVPDLEKKTTV